MTNGAPEKRFPKEQPQKVLHKLPLGRRPLTWYPSVYHGAVVEA